MKTFETIVLTCFLCTIVPCAQGVTLRGSIKNKNIEDYHRHLSPTAVCEDAVSLETELKLKNRILTCAQIVEQNRCGSLIFDDNGNSLGKAKFICAQSCGTCTLAPSPSPTESTSPTLSPTASPTITCEDAVSLDTELKLKNNLLTCGKIAEENRCGSLIFDDDGNSLGKAKFICVNSCGLCPFEPPTSSPTEFNDVATQSPTTAPSATASPTNFCEDAVSSDTELKLKNKMLTCEQIVEENRCGSLIFDDDGNSLGKAKSICIRSCTGCKFTLEPTSSPTASPAPTSSPTAPPTVSPTVSPAPTTSSAPTVCEDTVSSDTQLKLKNKILTCEQIVEQNKCGSLIFDDDGNSLGKAKFICVQSCGQCTLSPTSSPTETISPTTKFPTKSPTLSPTASPTITCEDAISSDTELKLKNNILTCEQIVEQNRCGSLIYDIDGNSLGKAKFICVKSCGRCNIA